jgi:hypothetical protein
MTNIDAWRPTERGRISATSTQGAGSSGCTWSFVCWGPKRVRVYRDERMSGEEISGSLGVLA